MGSKQTTNIGIHGEVQAGTYTSVATASDTPGTTNIVMVGNLLKVKEFALEIAQAGDNPVDLEAILSKFERSQSKEGNNNNIDDTSLIHPEDYDAVLQDLREGHGETMAANFVKNISKAAEYRSVASTGCIGIRDVKNGTQVFLNDGNQSVAVGGPTLLDVSNESSIYLGNTGQEKEGSEAPRQ